jgi:hypothetical protein
MTKKELVKIINEIVKKQVQKEINKIFIKEDTKLSLTDAVTFTTKKEKKDIKSYSKNPVLNRILNETKGGIPQGGQASYPSMGGGVYDTNNMQELVAHNLGIKPGVDGQVAREIGAVQTMKEAGVDPKQMPAVANAMTRDYSGLMKAMDKKKENK